MAVPFTGIKLSDIRAELGLVIASSFGDCVSAAGKTGVWNKFDDFAGYSAFVPSVTVTPTSMNFGALGSSKTATVTANTTWTVSDNATWISISGASNNGNDSFTISCSTNVNASSRNGTVTINWSGTNRTIAIYQEGDDGGCT